MQNFWQELKESTISQAVLTLGIWGTIIFLSVSGKPVPELLSTGGVAILGFWFGSKSTEAVIRSSKGNSGSGG